MKKIIFFALLSLPFLPVPEAKAQQVPLYSQYFENAFIYNPAFAGLDQFGSFNMTHRQQWEGLKGAPTTTLMTLDIPFYEFRSGFGINLHRDQIGFFEQYKAMFSYAYHIFGKYADSSTLSFGISGGFNYNQSNLQDAYVLHQNDPRIINNTGNFMATEFSFGLNYMFKDKFQIGLAAPQLLNMGVRAADNSTNNLNPKPHLLMSLRCTLKTYDEMHYLEPMVMVRYTMNTPYQIDAGVQYTFNRTFWVNAAYRMDYAAVLSVGFKLNKWRISAARDFAIGDLNGVTGGSTELMLGYKFGHLPKYKYPNPPGRNSNIRYKRYHPSIPGPLPRKMYLQQRGGKKSAKGFRKKK